VEIVHLYCAAIRAFLCRGGAQGSDKSNYALIVLLEYVTWSRLTCAFSDHHTSRARHGSDQKKRPGHARLNMYSYYWFFTFTLKTVFTFSIRQQ